MINWQLARFGIYKITDNVYVGQYPKDDAFKTLKDIGITTILNVSGGNYESMDFTVKNVPVVDLVEMPLSIADDIVNIIRGAVNSGGKIYVHCIAGQNRSPGSVFIGLLALGYNENTAIELIEDSTLDSVAKHDKIITDKVVAHIKKKYVI